MECVTYLHCNQMMLFASVTYLHCNQMMLFASKPTNRRNGQITDKLCVQQIQVADHISSLLHMGSSDEIDNIFRKFQNCRILHQSLTLSYLKMEIPPDRNMEKPLNRLFLSPSIHTPAPPTTRERRDTGV
ncbi:hypothetical protein ACOMHN_010476 [Nucella lapillus]